MKDLSLYIHWPYCVSKCPYCDFNSHLIQEIDLKVWKEKYRADLQEVLTLTGPRPLKTIFFGGGTPSLMPLALVEGILEEVAKLFPLKSNLEISLEANPNSVEVEKFKALGTLGINRLSLGIQSLRADRLQFLGRAHGVSEAQRAIETALASFPRVSMDLIYATPDQTLKAWENELQEAFTWGLSHLSLYTLTLEPGTAFYTRAQRGELVLPDEDLSSDFYELTGMLTQENGLHRYEISNYAKPEEESQHNLTYWTYGDYAGIGPGAHGRILNGSSRFATTFPKAPTTWLTGQMTADLLTSETAFEEALMMGLRLTHGISISSLFDLDSQKAAHVLSRAQDLPDDLSWGQDRLIPTAQGQLRLNAVLGYLLG